MNGKQILVVAGNYDIVQQIQQALIGEGFSLQSAYNHFDAVYAVKNSRFDLVFVDAAMTDRSSGQTTLATISRHNDRPPIVAFTPTGFTPERLDQMADKVLTTLDRQVLVQTLNSARELSGSATSKLSVEEKTSPRAEELQTLLSLSKSLTEVLDLGEVLNRVVEAARRLTNADEGMILLPDDDGGQLYLRARVGIDVEAARNFRVRTSDTLAGQVFSSGLPTLIGAQGPQKVKTEYFANSMLYVPIISQGKPIGVLGVNNRKKEDPFNQQQQELLISLASYAAVAIENALAHEETLQRARELQNLVDASQVINSSISLDKTLPNICEQLARMLNVNLTAIFEWHKERHELRLLARHERAIWRLKQGPQIEFTPLRTVRAAIEQNRYCWVTAQFAGASPEVNYLRNMGAAALLVIPIHSQEKLLGVVQAFYNHLPPQAPSQEIWGRARLNALEAATDIIDSSSNGRVQNSLRLAENINRLVGADWCKLALRVDETPAMRIQMSIGNGLWLDTPPPTIDLKRHPQLSSALEAQTIINPNTAEEEIPLEAQVLMNATFSRSILALPLIQRGQVQGLVVFGDTERSRTFSQREVDMGSAVVAQAATSLENARLMHDLEHSFQELKDTQERLIQAARLSAMGELAAAVAHQVNNPLTTIVVDTELMLFDEPSDSRNYNSLQAVLRAGKRAASVARRLLAISRPHDPEEPVSPIEVVDTIKGVITLTKSHLERSHVQVVANLPSEPLPPVYAVQGQLDDVWLNLILNAHDALTGRADACITVDATYTPGSVYLEVTVADNGPGIPEHIMSEIFKPFFTTKPPGEGTGLGLHICRQVIERVNGHISVESTPGTGTKFRVRLPVQVEE